MAKSHKSEDALESSARRPAVDAPESSPRRPVVYRVADRSAICGSRRGMLAAGAMVSESDFHSDAELAREIMAPHIRAGRLVPVK